MAYRRIDDAAVGADGGIQSRVQGFADQRVADGNLQHAGHGSEEFGQIGLAQVMPGIDAQAGCLRGAQSPRRDRNAAAAWPLAQASANGPV